MQLNNEFVVEAGTDETWTLLTDLERIAPCMPGASLTGREGEDYLGTVKIKVGPIGATFSGRARFVEQDAAAHQATIAMSGKDTKGAASASATIRARLEPVNSSATRVYVDTDLDITGRMAQFGRGAIADVSNRIFTQFTRNLEGLVAARPAAAAPVSALAPTAEPSVVRPIGGQVQPAAAGDLNLLDLMPTAVRQILAPLGMIALGWLIARAFPRRPKR